MIIKKPITHSNIKTIQKKDDNITLRTSENTTLNEIAQRIAALEQVIQNGNVYVDNIVLPTAAGSSASIQGVFNNDLLIQIGTETFGISLRPL